MDSGGINMNWKWIVLAVIIILIGIFVYTSYGSGYKMLRDWLLRDQRQVEEQLKGELSKVKVERDSYKKQLVTLKVQRQQLNEDYKSLQVKYDALKTKIENIPVPADTHSLVDAYTQRGYHPRVVLPAK